MSGHEIVRDVGVKVHVDVDQHSFAGVHAALGKITASCQGIIGSSGFGGIQSELAHVAGIVGKIFTGPLGIPIALAGAGAGVAALGFHVAETAKELKKAAAMSGIDAMHFQELAFAGKESEVGMEAMQHGLMFLNRSLFQAGEGSESAKHALANIGIKNPAAIKDVSEAIGDIADKIKSMPQQQQIGAAMAAFGRGGAAMLPMLRKGSEGILELIEEGKDLGVIMSADTMRMASALSESRKKVMATWEGISTRISAAIMPTLSSAMRGIAAWTKANRELISSGVDSFVSMIHLSIG
jgi:hypothetical protein